MAFQAPTREYRTWAFDSRRWDGYRPRPDDIIISTYPKCGTTWVQRIVQMLVFGSPEPLSLSEVSAWPDRRVGEPIEEVMKRIEGMTHRRFLKSHLPFDGLPIYDEVKYLHVARDGRDASMSFHHQALNFTPGFIASATAAGQADEAIGRAYPTPLEDPAEHFHRWLTEGIVPGDEDGVPSMSFFNTERTWWDARHRPNVLLVHFADLKADLAGEMHRIADFLEIRIAPEIWPALVEAAGFHAMRRDAENVLGKIAQSFKGGGESFFFKGENNRWRGVFRDEDLTLYEQKVSQFLSPECANWIAKGRLGGG